MVLCTAFHPYIFTVLLFALDNSEFTMGSIGVASMEFCFDVFKELKVHHANENIFYCPIAIMSALAMVYLGAKDSTRTQINKVSLQLKIKTFALLNGATALNCMIMSLGNCIAQRLKI